MDHPNGHIPRTPFAAQKEKILRLLNVPENEYSDLSPKGSVDEGIRLLIDDINKIDGLVTTSSCAGRVSVYLDGPMKTSKAVAEMDNTLNPTSSTTGGKGGGHWLFVSHDPLHIPDFDDSSSHFHERFGIHQPLESDVGRNICSKRFIHFKFEPMILHISAASLEDANSVLTAALSAGFRESGAVSLSVGKDGVISPMVAVRSTGLALNTIIGYSKDESIYISTVNERYLRLVASIANDRFKLNCGRIERFRALLMHLNTLSTGVSSVSKSKRLSWEHPEDRRRRKKEEGFRQQALQRARQDIMCTEVPSNGSPEIGNLFQE